MIVEIVVKQIVRIVKFKMEIEINKKEMIEITEEDFEAYEEVRTSGVTNMLVIASVSGLSGLNEEKVKAIIENYKKLSEAYPNIRQE